MSKRITITLKNIEALKTVDEYCGFYQCSRSSVISKIITNAAPLLNGINHHTCIVNELENTLFNSSPSYIEGSKSNDTHISLSEYIHLIWKKHILYKVVMGENRYRHTLKNARVGKGEMNDIQAELKYHLEWSHAKKAIFIYTDRLVDYEGKNAGGYSNTLLVNNTEYENYFFDFNEIFSLYINDIVFLGLQESISKEKIMFQYKYITFIPIYNTNEKVILIPVLDTTKTKPKNTHSPNIIIINPLQ